MTITTPADVRDLIASRVLAITPSLFSSDRFIEHRYELPLADWATANPAACLRRFSVTEGDSVEAPDVTDGQTEAVWQEFMIEVAYPTAWRHGHQQRVSLTNAISADRAQIAKTVGTNGFATYAAQTPPCTVETIEETRTEIGPVQIGIVRLRARYFRDATPGA